MSDPGTVGTRSTNTDAQSEAVDAFLAAGESLRRAAEALARIVPADGPGPVPPDPGPPDEGLPDLRALRILVPDDLSPGDEVRVGVTIGNEGGPSPEGEILDALFTFDDGFRVWSDNVSASLGAGEERDQIANGGDDPDGVWTVPDAAESEILCRINTGSATRDPIDEVDEDGNVVVLRVPISGASPVPPDPGPDPTPIPPGPSGTTSALAIWTGLAEWPNLSKGVGGVSFQSLAETGFSDLVVIANGPPAEWERGWYSSVANSTGLQVRPGFYGAGGGMEPPDNPTDQAEFLRRLDYCLARRPREDGDIALDLENYGHSTPWRGNRTEIRAFGREVGSRLKAARAHCLFYTSTAVTWEGSWIDKIHHIPGNWDPANYTTPLATFDSFYDGILDAGASMTYTDASFGFGVQVPGYDWYSGMRESVRLTHERFPAGTASIMTWPDIDEHRAPFSLGETRVFTDAQTKADTGIGATYQHHLADGTGSPAWSLPDGYLGSVQKALRAVRVEGVARMAARAS